MSKPRYRPPPPGRIAWPEIVVYVTPDGTRHCCPPPMNEVWLDRPSSQPYRFEIFDLAAFEELGCVRLDADKTGHQMLARAEVFCELVTEFGREILGPGDQVDRARLAAVAFASEQATRRLNEIVGGALWPEFRRRGIGRARQAGAGRPWYGMLTVCNSRSS